MMMPDVVVIQPSRVKAGLLLVGSIGFVMLGWSVQGDEPLLGWLGVAFFGMGIPVALAMLMPGLAYLRLDRVGFEINFLGRGRRTRWEDVQEFRIGSIRGVKMIGVHFRPARAAQKTTRALAKVFTGMGGAIANIYSVPLVELEGLLNERLIRFGKQPSAPASLHSLAHGAEEVEHEDAHVPLPLHYIRMLLMLGSSLLLFYAGFRLTNIVSGIQTVGLVGPYQLPFFSTAVEVTVLVTCIGLLGVRTIHVKWAGFTYVGLWFVLAAIHFWFHLPLVLDAPPPSPGYFTQAMISKNILIFHAYMLVAAVLLGWGVKVYATRLAHGGASRD